MTKEEFIEFIKELGFRQATPNNYTLSTDRTSQNYHRFTQYVLCLCVMTLFVDYVTIAYKMA
jgi:hypothetical protein